jgi:hypothetical protein
MNQCQSESPDYPGLRCVINHAGDDRSADQVGHYAMGFNWNETNAPADQPVHAMSFNTFTALDYIHAHDADAKKLSRKSAPTLRDIWRAELAKQGTFSLLGGPVRRDELVNAILDLRYPQAQAARDVFYAAVTR